jgi:hypothetical protein
MAQAVAMQHLTLDHPGKGLQTNVGMRPDTQTGAGSEHGRSGVIQKTPGSHHTPLRGRQDTANSDAPAHLCTACGHALDLFVTILVFRTIKGYGDFGTEGTHGSHSKNA